jgi:hypothetical protein
MKRTRVSRVWLVPALLLFIALLCVSVSQVLANSAEPEAPGSAEVVADVALETDPLNTFAEVAAAPPYTNYFPVLMQNAFTAFTYADDFESTSSGWGWRQGSFDAGYRTDGDTSKVWHYRMTTQDDIGFITGPTFVGGDFTYTAYLRRAMFEQPLYYFDEYGLLLSPNPVDVNEPTFSGTAYTFQIKLKIGSTVNSSYEVYSWTWPHKNTRSMILSQEAQDHEGKITDAAKIWNIFQISRTGDTLRFFLTVQGGALQEVGTVTDPSMPYVMYIGFYAAHSLTSNGDYPLEVQFDNVSTTSSPNY